MSRPSRSGYLALISSSVKFLITATIASTAPWAFAAEGDLDSDGQSDFFVITVGRNQGLSWDAALSSSGFGQSEDLGRFGKVGNHLIPASWTRPGVNEIGVVEEGARGNVKWKIVGADNQPHQITFGSSTDILVSGGDFNGDGIGDAAIISPSGQAIVKTDPFATLNSSARTEDHELSFPKGAVRSGKAVFVRREGGSDKLGFVRVQKRNGIPRYFLQLRGIDETKANVILAGVAASKLGEVHPIAGKRGGDNLLFVKNGARITITILDLRGTLLYREKFKKGTVLVGDYLPERGEEFAIYQDGKASVVNPFVKKPSAVEVTLPSGVAADLVNINSFTKKTGGGGNGGGGNGGGTPGDDDDDNEPIDPIDPGIPTDRSLGTVCPNVRDLAPGEIWKTRGSDHFSPGDPRKTSTSYIAVAGTPRPTFTCIQGFASNGGLAHLMGFYYPTGSEWSFRAYGAGTACSDGQSASAVASKLKAATGNYSLYLKVTPSTCVRIPDARLCYHSSSC